MTIYSFFEFTLKPHKKTPNSIARARKFFFDQGVRADQIIEVDEPNFYGLRSYSQSSDEVNYFESEFRKIRKKDFDFSVRILERSDWLDVWKKNYKPFYLGKKFRVVPEWCRPIKSNQRKIPIYLDPQDAFGAGTHATTRLMIRFLESLEGKFSSFLDIGTGTGILMIAARHLGAEHIDGMDISKEAVSAAKKNLKLNKCAPFRLKRSDLNRYGDKRQFDLVAANVISQTLVENQESIFRKVKENQYLIISGISRYNLKSFREEFSSPVVELQSIIKSAGWYALLYKKVQEQL